MMSKKIPAWTGASKLNGEGSWTWADHSIWYFNFGWRDGETDDEQKGEEGKKKDKCMRLSNSSSSQQQGWSDESCSSEELFVCSERICSGKNIMKWKTVSIGLDGLQCKNRAKCTSECPPDWDHVGDSCYFWSQEKLGWEEAEEHCQTHEGHLASVTSQAVLDYMHQKVGQSVQYKLSGRSYIAVQSYIWGKWEVMGGQW